MNIFRASLITQFRQHATNSNTQAQAEKAYEQLSPELPAEELYELHMAWQSYRRGILQAQELFDVCNKLIDKYRGGPPTRKTLICA